MVRRRKPSAYPNDGRGGWGGEVIRKILLLKACITGLATSCHYTLALTNHFMRDFEEEPSVGTTRICYYCCWFRKGYDNIAIWPH
jgi:hypothetical protein